jgi:RND family efflux transporter MFP subunit
MVSEWLVSGGIYAASFAVPVGVGEGLGADAMKLTMRQAIGQEGWKMMRCGGLIVVTAAALLAIGCGGSSGESNGNNSRPTSSASDPNAVNPATNSSPESAKVGDILSVLTVEHQVDIAAQRDGVVIAISKDEGGAVKTGEILAQLDDRTLQMELIKANDDLQVEDNNRKYKEAELKAKTAAFHRQQQLRALGLSSDADLEAAEFQEKAAEYDLHGYEALVESGHAEINRLQLEADQTRIHAPFSGVVVRRYVREGQAISKGDKTFRVSQLAPLQVQFQVPESSGKRPAVGVPVELSLVEDSARKLTAHVVKVSPTIDAASDSYDVLAQLAGPGVSDLRPGMAVKVIWPRISSPNSSPKP